MGQLDEDRIFCHFENGLPAATTDFEEPSLGKPYRSGYARMIVSDLQLFASASAVINRNWLHNEVSWQSEGTNTTLEILPKAFVLDLCLIRSPFCLHGNVLLRDNTK